MAVERHPKKNFTIVTNSVIDDSGLSLGAKGLLIHFLRMSSGWKMRIDYLVERTKESKYTIRRYLKELREMDYIDIKQYYDPIKNRFAGSYYVLKETAKSEIADRDLKIDDSTSGKQSEQTYHKYRGSAKTESLQNEGGHNKTNDMLYNKTNNKYIEGNTIYNTIGEAEESDENEEGPEDIVYGSEEFHRIMREAMGEI